MGRFNLTPYRPIAPAPPFTCGCGQILAEPKPDVITGAADTFCRCPVCSAVHQSYTSIGYGRQWTAYGSAISRDAAPLAIVYVPALPDFPPITDTESLGVFTDYLTEHVTCPLSAARCVLAKAGLSGHDPLRLKWRHGRYSVAVQLSGRRVPTSGLRPFFRLPGEREIFIHTTAEHAGALSRAAGGLKALTMRNCPDELAFAVWAVEAILEAGIDLHGGYPPVREPDTPFAEFWGP